MKKFHGVLSTLSFLMLVTSSNAGAQNAPQKVIIARTSAEPPEKGFKKHNMFTGGGVAASFFSGGTLLGASPVIGYKLNDYIDAGALINYVYNGARDWKETNDKYRRHIIGSGIFMRAYPVPFLFVQAQLEQNFISEKYIAKPGSAYYKDGKFTANPTSLLLGGGLSTGRLKGGTTFFYLSVMADVLKNRNSPYVSVSNYGQSNERIRVIPVIRAGVNIGLFQQRYGAYDY